MKRYRLCTALASLVLAGAALPALAAPTLGIIPAPVSMEIEEGVFRMNAATSIHLRPSTEFRAQILADILGPDLGFKLNSDAGSPGNNTLSLGIDESLKGEVGTEGYVLNVTPMRIELSAAAPAGLFYGGQTLRQLLDGREIPCLSITDYPRFRWRGLLIDPARHFIPMDDFKHVIDAMAMHKLNRLQVHFTDNEGWRIEIKRYPKLTELGSRMDWTHRRGRSEEPEHGGFYTQDEIRKLVRYAAERHITIVPEIEMPFHAGSAIVAYPEHGVNTKSLSEVPVEKRWGPSKGLLGARPETVAFLQDILTEVVELFPSRYIHIGGDEANIRVWADDPEMQAVMKRLGCKDAHELHSWFIKQMDAFLSKNGRRMVGWDEILQGGLAPGATVMSWRGITGGIAAAKAKHDVVMAPTSHTYFDYRQAPDELGLGKSVIGVDKVYGFEPVPAELSADEARHVLGGQGQLWGELISEAKRRDFMAWPRACALSEVLWSPKSKRSLPQFLSRLSKHLKRLERAGIHYRPLDAELLEIAAEPE